MSLHATYNPHLLAPPQSRYPSSSSSHHHHHNHHHNRLNQLNQQAQASSSTTSLNTSTGFGAKIRNVFDAQKYANFETKITIHETANIPQLQGEFNCNWRIRGRSPKNRDSMNHKPSLPNLRLTQASKHQDSTTSLPVRSASDDKPSSSSTSHAMKGKSMSTPPISLGLGHFLPSGKHKNVDKKGSDPTPLRNSLLGSDLHPVESPVCTHSHEDDTPIASRPMGMGGGRDSASSSLYNPTSTAASSTSYLSVPGPSRNSTDGIEGAHTPTPNQAGAPIERSASRQTMSKSKSNPNNISTHRTGTTANKPLDKNHTCTWDQELHFTLRIPISKSEERREEYKSKLPILGEGPKSASGLRLIIQQLPNPSATSTTQPKSNTTAETEIHHSPAHSAAIHAAAMDKEKDKENEEIGGKHEKHEKVGAHHPKGKATPFGRVNIDLAAFAGKGRTTRKFLLKGSRTNATVQITVEMNWVGGDKDWAAPPLIEGHHVTGRVKDMVGGRDNSENLHKDLQLMKTPSHSSTGSSISQGGSSLSRNTTNGIPRSKMHPKFKTYEHHLLSPDDAKFRTPIASSSKMGQDATSPDDRRAETPGLNHEDGTEASSSPQTPTNTNRNFYHRHKAHFKRRTIDVDAEPRKTLGIPEMDARVIIEAIFNPVPGRENGPFTYIPDAPVHVHQEEELRGEAEHHESQPHEHGHGHEHDGPEAVVGKRIGWRRRRTERKDTVSSVMTLHGSGRTVSSATTATVRNLSPNRGGRGRNASPGKMPRTGSSGAIHA